MFKNKKINNSINAQEWLDQNYSDKELEELNISDLDLKGDLIIDNFSKLRSIKCGNNSEISSLELINLTKLESIHAGNCKIKTIIINNCPVISSLNVSNNLLTSTYFLRELKPESLNLLSIHSNNFNKQDLSFLQNFINLKRLFIDNHDQGKFSEGIYNRFIGSLVHLKKLDKLEYINVANTEIDSGVEDLPESLKKICLINGWERNDNLYLEEIKWQIEKASRLPKITEKLKDKEEDEPPFVKDWYRIAPLRQALNLLGKEVFEKKTKWCDAQEWLNKKYPPHTNRKHYKELAINDENLRGNLDLSDFIGLEKLNCSENQLTGLNLTKCENLIKLILSNNQFIDTIFLKELSQPDKLELLKIGGNFKIKENLKFLTEFIRLEEVDLSNCSFLGSLKYLEKAEDLRIINISNTDIDSGLEFLSDSCRELNSDPDSKKKSAKIAKLLCKYRETLVNGHSFYNLSKWREEWRSNIILSIPSERLYVIRGNIKRFINKWNKNEKNDLNITKLSKLISPEELWKYRWTIYFNQLIGRSSAVIGASFLFRDSQAIGGGILGIYPLAELISSKLEESLKNKEKEWKEFISDSEIFLDNYHELLGILGNIEYKLGSVNQAIKELKSSVDAFLERYDKNENKIIDISELSDKEAREKLMIDLNEEELYGEERGGRLVNIVDLIRELERKIIEYRRGSYRENYGIERENINLQSPRLSAEKNSNDFNELSMEASEGLEFNLNNRESSLKNQQHHQDCPFCKWVKEKPEYFIEENNNFLSLTNISPDSEGHVLIISKQFRTNITELTPEEWSDLFPILRSTTNRLINVFSPKGFNVYSNSGSEGSARQAVFHFHLHIISEREGSRGIGYLRKPWYIPSIQKYEKIRNNLGIKENSRAIVKLAEREESSDEGHLIINTKDIIESNLNKIDLEIWDEMGKLLREAIREINEFPNIKSLRTCIFLGQIGGLKDNSQFQIHLIPRYSSKGADSKEIIPVPSEVLEVTEKLKNAENKIEDKKVEFSEQTEVKIEVLIK